MEVVFYVKCSPFMSDFNQNWNALTDFTKNLKYEISRLGMSVLLCVPCGQTDGRTDRQTDMARLRVAFLDLFARATENRAYLLMVIGFYDIVVRNISDEIGAS
jgi:hypothetical protein